MTSSSLTPVLLAGIRTVDPFIGCIGSLFSLTERVSTATSAGGQKDKKLYGSYSSLSSNKIAYLRQNRALLH